MIEILVIYPVEPPSRLSVEGTLEDFQELVGGMVQAVPCYYGVDDLYVNEEGAMLVLEINPVATALTPAGRGGFIRGTAVMVGTASPTGDETSVSESGAELAEDVHRLARLLSTPF